jgi:integrase
MTEELVLTRDNYPLSRPNPLRAINCKHIKIAVADYVRDSLAANSWRAYAADIRHFQNWGGNIPAVDSMIASYLAAHSDLLTVATLVRRLTSISQAHVAGGYPNPVRSPLVRATLRGIKRRYGSAQRQAKPLTKEDLFIVLGAMGDTMKDVRDRALLLLGFAGVFRRSELVAIDKEDVTAARQGIIVRLNRSKTDQVGQGRDVAVPHGRGRWCPVSSLDLWFSRAGICGGAAFRPIDRFGHVGTGRLSGEAVSLIIKARVSAAGFDPRLYSGHSLRAGFATSAAQAGVSSWNIRRQTGHASDAMLAKYIRAAELFIDNPAGALL